MSIDAIRGYGSQLIDHIPGLGGRTVGPFTHCADCEPGAHPAVAGTFTRYGGKPLCRPHAFSRLTASGGTVPSGTGKE